MDLGMDQGLGSSMLQSIREGMEVYDIQGDKVGHVEYVQFGDEDVTTLGTDTQTAVDPALRRDDSLMENIAEALTPDNDLPEQLASQMIREGYIKIGTGMLRSDRYALMSQVASVTAERVDLNAHKDALVTR